MGSLFRHGWRLGDEEAERVLKQIMEAVPDFSAARGPRFISLLRRKRLRPAALELFTFSARPLRSGSQDDLCRY
jgi:hypothetical protein